MFKWVTGLQYLMCPVLYFWVYRICSPGGGSLSLSHPGDFTLLYHHGRWWDTWLCSLSWSQRLSLAILALCQDNHFNWTGSLIFSICSVPKFCFVSARDATRAPNTHFNDSFLTVQPRSAFYSGSLFDLCVVPWIVHFWRETQKHHNSDATSSCRYLSNALSASQLCTSLLRLYNTQYTQSKYTSLYFVPSLLLPNTPSQNKL